MWVAKTPPWLISPDGHRIDLEVHGNLPFLRVGDVAAVAMVAQVVPKILPTQAEQDMSDEECCAPVKERPCTGCTNSRSALSAKHSVIVLDSDEESLNQSEASSHSSSDDESKVYSKTSEESSKETPDPL